MKITLTLPEEMIKTMGITEDTLFITSYENGQIQIEPYDEEDLEDDFPYEDAFDEEFFRDIQMDTAADLKTHTKDCRITTIIAAA